MFCQKCGNEINDDAVVCIHCGCAVNGKAKPMGEDKVSGLFMLLSILFPIFGVIYGACTYGSKPNSAKTYIITSVVVFVISYAALMLLYM